VNVSQTEEYLLYGFIRLTTYSRHRRKVW